MSETRGSLEVRGVSLSHGSQPVLRGLDFTVASGEFVTLLGPSGCGKTTLLRLIAGLDAAGAGSISVSGRDVTARPAHERPVHTVFQNYALFPHLNVFENVAFGLRIRSAPEEEILRRVAEALALVRLEGLDARGVAQISGGQAQRVALARALVLKPDILLLDEPLAALDARLRSEMRRELRAVQQALRMTFIFVTHDLEEAIELSDRIAVMESGRIAQFGSPMEVFERPANRYVADLVGVPNFFPGAVVSRENGAALVDIGFTRVRVEPAPTADTVTLALRGEHAALRGEGPPRARAVVREARYLGDAVRCVVEVSGRSVVAETAPLGSALPSGEVGLWIEDARFVPLS